MKLIIFSAIFLCAVLGVSFAFAQYLPPPPPSSAIRYAPPQQSTTPTPPPPGGWTQSQYNSNYPSSLPPPPPPDPKLKDFPIDLDLNDFAKRNSRPNEHCFFRVKNKKDIIEFVPNQEGGTFNFPTGTCNLGNEKCYIAERKGRLPGMKKTEPPIYGGMWESSSRGFAVIPYKYTDDIDFSMCIASWTGYFEADDYKVHLYKPPKRDYSKQSCYHPLNALEEGRVFCDGEKCQLTENQYCDNKTGQCYLNDYPLKNKKGKSVTTFERYPSINWDFCTDAKGALIPEDGGLPYEERFQPGCSYRIEAPNYHEKQYAGKIDFLIKCDENRCSGSGLNFDMGRKEYWTNLINDKVIYTKTPPMREFLTIDWTCRDATKIPDYNKKLLCNYINSDGTAPDCQLCYENRKFVYKNCKIPYDELGRRTDIPAELRRYNLYDEIQRLRGTIEALSGNAEIPLDMGQWFLGLVRGTELQYYNIDEPQRYRMASVVAQFNNLSNPLEKDVKKFKRQIISFVTENIKKIIDGEIQYFKDGQCKICRTSTAEDKLSSPIREACSICGG